MGKPHIGVRPPSGAIGRGSSLSTDFQSTQNSERFQTLKKRHRGFVFPVAVAFLVWYFAYVLLAAYAKDFMATPVFLSLIHI